MKVNHIGYWVDCIKKSVNIFHMLGYKQKSDVFYDESKDCYICFLDNNSIRVKLIEPANNSYMYNLLNEHEKQDFHICYETTFFEQDILNLQNEGFKIFKDHFCDMSIKDEKAVFLSKNNDGFIEILKAS